MPFAAEVPVPALARGGPDVKNLDNMPAIGGERDLADVVLAADGITAVIFGADWCPDCRRFAPVFAALADEYAGRLAFAQVDTAALPDLEARYRIGLIPSVLLFRAGEVIHTWEFIEDPAAYRKVFDELAPQV